MIIGSCSIELHLPESVSLKNKRQIVKGLKDRIRNKFNVSIAEVDGNDLWQRAVLGVGIVANDKKFANQVLAQVVEQVKRERSVVLLDYHLEIY